MSQASDHMGSRSETSRVAVSCGCGMALIVGSAYSCVFPFYARDDIEHAMNSPSSRRRPLRGLHRSQSAEQALVGDALGLPLVRRVAVIRSQSASRITWHTHDQFEVLFLLEGATSYEFADGRTVELPGGHFLIVPPGVRHRGLHDVRKPVQLCGIMFDPQAKQATRQSPFSRTDLAWISRRCRQGGMEARRLSPELRRLVRTLNQQVTAKEAQDAASAALRLTLCATLLEAARQLTTVGTQEPTRAVQIAIDYMERHLAEPLPMNAVARAANSSRARLFHNFKDATGLTPNDYLQRLRISRAQDALTASAEPITAVALRYGFASSQYFSTVFRKYTGITPQQYRRRHGRQLLKPS